MAVTTNVILLSICERLPRWVDEGFSEYAERLKRSVHLKCIDLELAQRSKSTDVKRAVQEEGARLLSHIPKGALVVALDSEGKLLESEAFAMQCTHWRDQYRDWVFLIGGPDGLSAECLAAAHTKLSLGRMTLPHALVRIVIAEQLFRAQCITSNHPYHRAGKKH
jgi:23S rRNA (pseudouridine1915-N3)-methyltransferase